MKAGLWGHALLLASKMDSRTHARVMTKYKFVPLKGFSSIYPYILITFCFGLLGLQIVYQWMILFRRFTSWCQEECLHQPPWVFLLSFISDLSFAAILFHWPRLKHIEFRVFVAALAELYFKFFCSAVERRNGATGVLTWPWCCQTFHRLWTWILAQSPPWVTLLVRWKWKEHHFIVFNWVFECFFFLFVLFVLGSF